MLRPVLVVTVGAHRLSTGAWLDDEDGIVGSECVTRCSELFSEVASSI